MLKEYSKKLANEIASKIWMVQVKENVENWTFKVVASDETVDRSGETIKIDSWDLKNYMKNPIILFGHDYRSLDSIAGKATNVYVEKNQLIVEGVFAWTEPAQMLRQLYDEGIMKTVSVGFIAKKRDPNNPKIITEAELLELSFVPVPCNPNALSLNKDVLNAMVEKWLIKEIDETNSDDPTKEGDQQENVDETVETVDANVDQDVEENEQPVEETDDQKDGEEKPLDNESEKSINEKEIVDLWEYDEPLWKQMRDKIKEKQVSDKIHVSIVEIYAKHFIFELWVDYDEVDEFNEDMLWFYDQAYSLNENVVEFVGDAVKVEPKVVWISKGHSNAIKDLISEIKGSWTSDDKDDDVEKAHAKIQLQKEALQNVSKVVSDALHKIKL